MKVISQKAKLSKIYTNHCIRKTAATGMQREGYSLKEIANVTKHKNLHSLEHYIGGANQQDKQNYLDSLFNYSKNQDKAKKRQYENTSPERSKKKQDTIKENIQPETALIPLEHDFSDSETSCNVIPLSQNVIQNQMKQAANMFQGAMFNNCTINFQMSK